MTPSPPQRDAMDARVLTEAASHPRVAAATEPYLICRQVQQVLFGTV